jgi:hypothetical protein
MGAFDFYWLSKAQDGDWETLAEFIKNSHGEIGTDIRKFLAGVLRGEITRKAHRPRKEATWELGEHIAYFVVQAERGGMRTGKAIEAAAKKFRVATRTVQRKLALHRHGVE